MRYALEANSAAIIQGTIQREVIRPNHTQRTRYMTLSGRIEAGLPDKSSPTLENHFRNLAILTSQQRLPRFSNFFPTGFSVLRHHVRFITRPFSFNLLSLSTTRSHVTNFERRVSNSDRISRLSIRRLNLSPSLSISIASSVSSSSAVLATLYDKPGRVLTSMNSK